MMGRKLRIAMLAAMLFAMCTAVCFGAEGPAVKVSKTGAGVYQVSYAGDPAAKGKLVNVFAYRGQLESAAGGLPIRDENFLDGETAVIGSGGEFTVTLRLKTEDGAVIYMGGEDRLLPGGKSPALLAARILARPKSLSVSAAGYDSLRLSWAKTAGAKQYRVFRGESKSGINTKTPVATVTTNGYTDRKLVTGKTYYYAVQAYDPDLPSEISAAAGAAPCLKAANLKSAGASGAKAALTWSAVDGASGYQIFKTTNTAKWPAAPAATINNPKTLTWMDSSGPMETKLSYRIRAFRKVGGRTVVSAYSGVRSVTLRLKAAKLKSLKVKKRTIALKWTAVEGADGYVIYRAVKKNKKYKKIATVKGGKKTGYTNKKLKKKTKYYYKIRPYCKAGGKTVLGPYSNVKMKKTKK